MPNLRIVSDNAIARASSLVASSTAGALAVSNLASDKKSAVHRATGKTVTYTATWGEAEQVGCVALPFCNLSPTAQWRVRATAELGTTNLLKFTETFNTSSPTWCLPGLSTYNIASNTGVAPDGASTADRFTWTSGGGTLQYLSQTVTGLADNAVYSGSVFVKAQELERVALTLMDKSGGISVLDVNLEDGRTSYIQQAAGQAVTVDVVPAPNGYHRLKLKGWNSLAGGTSPTFRIFPGLQSTIARMFTKSNLSANDVDTGNAYPNWRVSEVTEVTGTSSLHRYAEVPIRAEAGRTLVVELAVKQKSGTQRYVGAAMSSGGVSQGVMLNLSTGAISYQVGADVKNASVEAVANGYWRLRFEFTPKADVTAYMSFRINTASNVLVAPYVAMTGNEVTVQVGKFYISPLVTDNTYAPMLTSGYNLSQEYSTTKGMLVWGAMLEPGPQVTSYYPSVAATPGVRPDGYMDNWQGAGYDSGWVLACPAPAVKLRGFTAAQASSAYAYGGGACGRHWLPAAVMVRTLSVEINDPGNFQGYVEAAACMVVGPVLTTRYNASATSVSVIDRTEISRGAAGDQLVDPGTISRKVPVDLRAMPEVDRARFLDLVRNSRAYPILMSVFPEHPDLALERDFTVYGRRTKDSDIAYQFAGAYSTTLEIEEI
ncbi:hypothetical protein QPK31_15205 [Massilia sp. YIM B02769]|uniref:phage head spike fiber domain-containing protein n=1 Tax=Massilia sp. YIM B02769 TaxID=3050129 RepID=UPI0025B727A3|nr:hypothetical protein [Massilia sp. YIM B02769]MDN4059573.1 hypothetical protein [Massilia sp. YIM B02769]